MKNITVGIASTLLITGCGGFSNTAEDVQIQTAYYEAKKAELSQGKKSTFEIEMGDNGCPGCKIRYNDPRDNVSTLDRAKTSAEVSARMAEALMSPLTTLIQFGGVYGIVKAAVSNAGTGNTTTTTTIAGQGNTSTATPTATNSTSNNNGTFSDSHASSVDSHDATATPTVVDTTVVEVRPEVVNTQVVNPQVVNPQIVEPTIINNGAVP